MSNYTDFTNADLTGITTFQNSNLSYATFTGAILTTTNLTNAILTGIISGGVVFKNTASGTTTVYDSSYASDGTTLNPGKPSLPPNWSVIKGYLVGPKADLTNANFAGASGSLTNMKGLRVFAADFTGANLSYVDFTGSSLSKCNFSGAILTGANFTDCNLENCVFSGTTISTATTFANTNLNGIVTGAMIDATTKNKVSSTGLTDATYGTQLPYGWSFNFGYMVGPGAYLFNAKFN